VKKLLTIGAVAAAHFALAHLVSAVVLSVTPEAVLADSPPMAAALLVAAAKLLHFPVISHVLYPRQLFPGNWIILPMVLNSLVWGATLCTAWWIGRRLVSDRRADR
jgi:hypothetical protein